MPQLARTSGLLGETNTSGSTFAKGRQFLKCGRGITGELDPPRAAELVLDLQADSFGVKTPSASMHCRRSDEVDRMTLPGRI